MSAKTKKPAPPSKKRIEDASKVLASLVAVDDLAVLGVATTIFDKGTPRADTFRLVENVAVFLRDSAEAMREAARKKAATRVPLIAPRYAKTLAESIHGQLATRGEGAAWTWLSVAMPSLHAAYMQGTAATMSTHDAHPGSRAGVIIVDARKLEDFADDAGKTTAASVLARVRGEPKPKGGA